MSRIICMKCKAGADSDGAYLACRSCFEGLKAELSRVREELAQLKKDFGERNGNLCRMLNESLAKNADLRARLEAEQAARALLTSEVQRICTMSCGCRPICVCPMEQTRPFRDALADAIENLPPNPILERLRAAEVCAETLEGLPAWDTDPRVMAWRKARGE